jgi:arginine-tRNA-protein transferase
MDNPTRKQYREFLLSSWAETLLVEFRLGGHLVAVAVTDHLSDGLSAVYTFFDPDFSRRGIGTFSILWQIAETRQLGFQWLYLGYWIAESPKMLYKREFQPQERFIDGRWRTFGR